MSKTESRNLVWMDLEMTGLDAETCVIIEAAVLITDSDLNVIAQGPVIAVHQPEAHLAAMDAWNTEHHTKSGLAARVRASTIGPREAETQIIEFIQAYCGPKSAPLCGNSIWQDRRFIAKYWPALNEYLHYRVIDVSTVKELARRWRPDIIEKAPPKKDAHLALDDILESLEELKYYRRVFLRAGPES